MKRVLLVEDDGELTNTLTEVLHGMVDIFVAETVAQAERLFNRLHPDIVILDGEVLDGPTSTFAARLREDGFAGPMVAASGNTQRQKDLMNAGCSAELPKPYGAEPLLNLIRSFTDEAPLATHTATQ